MTNWGDPVAPEFVPLGTEAIANFDNGGLIGSTGCNNYRTTSEVSETHLNVSDQIASTRKACPPPLDELEAQFLAALAGAQKYRLNEAGALEISYANNLGWGLLRLVPAPDSERVVYVAPEQVDCVGVAPQRCLQVRNHPREPWQNLYQSIEGFEYEPGYRYRLRIAEQPVVNPPADAPDRRLLLVEMLERTPIETAGDDRALP